jgi:hypothetical protein
MTTLYRIEDSSLLTSVLDGEGVYLGPAAVLEGLTADQAHEKPHGLPHSIAEIVAAASDALGDPVLPPGIDIAVLARESRGACILHAAMHNSHHLGQIITMRQLMGLWPPPSGTITW